MLKKEEIIISHWNASAHVFLDTISLQDFRVGALLYFFQNVNNKKILDVGCGKGRFSKILCESGARVIGVDPSIEMLKTAKQIDGGKFLLGEATNLNFPDNFFDFVFAIESLEFVINLKKAIKEMTRVLKKGGKIMIMGRNYLGVDNTIKENILCRRLKLPVPSILHKKYSQLYDRFVSKKNFPFSLHWFFPWQINNLLKKYCQKTSIDYPEKNGLHKWFPFLSEFVFWKGIK